MSGKLSTNVCYQKMNNESGTSTSSSDRDVITVTLVPQKKGLFLKHSEYEISSRKWKCTVHRRYNDFVHFQGLLLTKFPYRMIPRLPPKQLMLDSLLEERRRGLDRWLRIVSRHPTMGHGLMLQSFLSDASPEHQQHLRDIYEKELDEFINLNEDVELPLEDQGRLAASREMMRAMLNALTKLKKIIEQQALRSNAQSKDMDEMGTVFKLLGSASNVFDANPFAEMAQCVQEISKESSKYAECQQNIICERLSLLLDVLAAHSDLCERVEHGIVSEHQKALSKMLSLNKQKIKGVIRGTGAESVAALHEKEVAQTGVVGTLGRRSAFSLHCVLQETSLAQDYLQVLTSIMLSFAHEQNQEHYKISQIWKRTITTEATRLNS